MTEPRTGQFDYISIDSVNTPIRLLTTEQFSPDALAYLWEAIENNKSILFIGGSQSRVQETMDCLRFFEDDGTYTIKLGIEELPQNELDDLLGSIKNSQHPIHMNINANTIQDLKPMFETTSIDPFEMFDIFVVQRRLFYGDKDIYRNVSISESTSNENGTTLQEIVKRDPKTDDWSHYINDTELWGSEKETHIQNITEKTETLKDLQEKDIETVAEFEEQSPF